VVDTYLLTLPPDYEHVMHLNFDESWTSYLKPEVLPARLPSRFGLAAYESPDATIFRLYPQLAERLIAHVELHAQPVLDYGRARANESTHIERLLVAHDRRHASRSLGYGEKAVQAFDYACTAYEIYGECTEDDAHEVEEGGYLSGCAASVIEESLKLFAGVGSGFSLECISNPQLKECGGGPFCETAEGQYESSCMRARCQAKARAGRRD